jgi:hypothetical protein
LLPLSRTAIGTVNRRTGELTIAILGHFVVILLAISTLGQVNSTSAPQAHDSITAQSVKATSAPESLDKVIDRVVERQHLFISEMRHFQPLVETYIQNFRSSKRAGTGPVGDQYFLGRLELSGRATDRSLLDQPDLSRRMLERLPALYKLKFLPLGFAQMALLDDDFQRNYYIFTFVRWEYLGEVRCLILDVKPKKNAGKGRFLGRMWVEDQDYNIMRFEGTYTPRPRFGSYLHFDSWRLNLQPGLWFPAYIYSEESPLRHGLRQKLRLKAQTRLWGYEPDQLKQLQEFTHIVVESPGVTDQADAPRDNVPVESERQWEGEAEDNAIARLEKIGLIAPSGQVDNVLQTVVNNLLLTNELKIQPEVRTRVLLISPLESFTIGHTIVLSRGLLDVLPDEASLAVILAHELGHIALGHNLDTKFAFGDRMFFADEDTFKRLNFIHNPNDEEAADKKALALLANSPYKDDLANARLFLEAVRTCAPRLKSLIRPHLGDSVANERYLPFPALLNSAAGKGEPLTGQIAALPLGSRIKLNPWNNRIELLETKADVANTGQQINPFELTPFFPDLTRLPSADSDKVARSFTTESEKQGERQGP